MNILDEIIDVKKEEVKKLRKEYTYGRFTDSEFYGKEKLSLYDALSKTDDIAIIAEVKKASPSKGVIRNDFDHMKIADVYMENGAEAISILTDVNFFQGSLTYLSDIAQIKTKPLLRKDFIIDEYQVFEAKHYGADAVLLIAEVLSARQINELTHAAYETGLDVLLELHSADQLNKIDLVLNKLIGVNNRNLNDFTVDVNTTLHLAEKLPGDVVLVSESGISMQETIEELKLTNVNAVLVGEYLMRAEDIKGRLNQLAEWCSRES